MAVLYEETPEEIEAREADERRHQVLMDRLHAAEAQRAAERRKEMARIDQALDTIDQGDPMLIAEVRARRAVRGGPLLQNLRPPPGPSLGGLTTAQMEEVGRRQASAERAWQNEQRARKAWQAGREEQIADLVAGQSQENQERIRRTIKSGG